MKRLNLLLSILDHWIIIAGIDETLELMNIERCRTACTTDRPSNRIESSFPFSWTPREQTQNVLCVAFCSTCNTSRLRARSKRPVAVPTTRCLWCLRFVQLKREEYSNVIAKPMAFSFCTSHDYFWMRQLSHNFTRRCQSCIPRSLDNLRHKNYFFCHNSEKQLLDHHSVESTWDDALDSTGVYCGMTESLSPNDRLASNPWWFVVIF